MTKYRFGDINFVNKTVHSNGQKNLKKVSTQTTLDKGIDTTNFTEIDFCDEERKNEALYIFLKDYIEDKKQNLLKKNSN